MQALGGVNDRQCLVGVIQNRQIQRPSEQLFVLDVLRERHERAAGNFVHGAIEVQRNLADGAVIKPECRVQADQTLRKSMGFAQPRLFEQFSQSGQVALGTSTNVERRH